VQDLLWLLKYERLYDRWISTYLAALYAHPTHPIIGGLASEAWTIAASTGRTPEIESAFRHLMAIPLEFESKRLVKAAMTRPAVRPPSSTLRAACTKNPISARFIPPCKPEG
jgi:hypothetical protein